MCYDLSSKLDKVVALVMQNQAEKAIALMESGGFDKHLLDDIGCCESSLPLYKLSMCNAILLNDDNWTKKFFPIVERNRIGCKKLLDYWEKQWKYPIGVPLDFGMYQSECAHFNDWDWDMESLLDGNMSELMALGYNEAEVEFCYAVLTYKSDLIQKHIEKRTNPNVYISGTVPFGKGRYDDGVSYNALECCSTFCCDAFDCYGLAGLWSNTQDQKVSAKDVHLLLEAAAYCDLEKKIRKVKVMD